MRDARLKSTILYNLRKNQKMSLDDLMKVSTGKNTFQENTGDAIFFEIIIDLFKARFIQLSDHETENYLKRYKGNTHHFSDGYDFANFLKFRDEKETLHSIIILCLLLTIQQICCIIITTDKRGKDKNE